jgi:hypothetical protein
MRLTRCDIESALCAELGLKRPQARRVLAEFSEAVIRALASGDIVRLRGFGTLAVSTGSSGGAGRVRFRGSRRLREALREEAGAPDPSLTLLQRQLESAAGVERMLERHREWCEGHAGERPDLARLNLEGTDLFGATLRAAKLTGAEMSRVDMGEADLQEADLERADLSHASLAWANLQRANLRGACLKGADMRWADLRHADLSDADLGGANLRDALLDGARFDAGPCAPAPGAGLSRFARLRERWRSIRLFYPAAEKQRLSP